MCTLAELLGAQHLEGRFVVRNVSIRGVFCCSTVLE